MYSYYYTPVGYTRRKKFLVLCLMLQMSTKVLEKTMYVLYIYFYGIVVMVHHVNFITIY